MASQLVPCEREIPPSEEMRYVTRKFALLPIFSFSRKERRLFPIGLLHILCDSCAEGECENAKLPSDDEPTTFPSAFL